MGGDFIMIGQRLVREDNVGTALKVIKKLEHIWSSGLAHLCQHVLATRISVISTECDVVFLTADVTSISHLL